MSASGGGDERRRQRALISIVIPVYNEEQNVPAAYDAVCRVFGQLEGYEFEIVFTDNHSDDGTFAAIAALAARDRRVKALRFNRNYGFQRSLMTAYRHAAGDAAVQLDCDLQDPPELLVRFLELWQAGHDAVVGVRRQRPEPALLSFARRRFYTLLDRLSEEGLTLDAGDFRLLDRRILDQLRGIDDVHPYVRGLVGSLACNEATVVYDRRARSHGKSKFPLRQLVSFGLEAIVSHSIVPLRLATYVGLALAIVTAGLGLQYFARALLWGGNAPHGFATITVLLLLGMSLNAIFLGLLGEYVSRIYQQLRGRPLVIIERSLNLSAPPPGSAPGRAAPDEETTC